MENRKQNANITIYGDIHVHFVDARKINEAPTRYETRTSGDRDNEAMRQAWRRFYRANSL